MPPSDAVTAAAAGTPAIAGGTPVRARMLPYGRQTTTDDDIAAVSRVLSSDWLTTGPMVGEFERRIAALAGVAHGVAVSSGTAALHAAMHAAGVGSGDEVIVPAITFAASSNAAIYEGATPVFADVDPDTLLIDPASVAACLTAKTRAVVAVDYAGQPADYAAIEASVNRRPASGRSVAIVADACHALGARDAGRPVGRLAAMSCFSFHPVKHVTTGEGGMVVTDDAGFAERMRVFRNHGITSDHRQREAVGAFHYEMVELGWNYRLSDLQCALGVSQVERLSQFLARRTAIAARYDAAFAGLDGVQPLRVRPGVEHAYHLYVILLDLDRLRVDRAEVFRALRAENIGVNVHYMPVYLHPYYRARFGFAPGLCPRAETAYARMLSLPMFPAMSDADADDVIAAVARVLGHYRR